MHVKNIMESIITITPGKRKEKYTEIQIAEDYRRVIHVSTSANATNVEKKIQKKKVSRKARKVAKKTKNQSRS